MYKVQKSNPQLAIQKPFSNPCPVKVVYQFEFSSLKEKLSSSGKSVANRLHQRRIKTQVDKP
jgi:hypothetical protein